MRTRIGAAMMIAVAALFLTGSLGFGGMHTDPDYAVTTSAGFILPVSVD